MTAYEMLISDWSSYVCSSDLLHRLVTASIQPDRHLVISMGGAGVFGPRLREAGIPVHTLHMGSPVGMVKGLWRMYRLLCELNPDIVQTWMYHADLIDRKSTRLNSSH